MLSERKRRFFTIFVSSLGSRMDAEIEGTSFPSRPRLPGRRPRWLWRVLGDLVGARAPVPHPSGTQGFPGIRVPERCPTYLAHRGFPAFVYQRSALLLLTCSMGRAGLQLESPLAPNTIMILFASWPRFQRPAPSGVKKTCCCDDATCLTPP